MDNNQLLKMVEFLGLSTEDIESRDHILSKILTCAVEVK